MVELARQRLGDDADLHVADLAAPQPFADAEFDDVVASLVLHYLEDWAVPLAEFRRVLKPGGRLFVSVNHPAAYAIGYPEADYFALTQYSEDYVFGDQTVWLTFWHRPLHAMAEAFCRCGVSHRSDQRTATRPGHSAGASPTRPARPVLHRLPLLRPRGRLRPNPDRTKRSCGGSPQPLGKVPSGSSTLARKAAVGMSGLAGDMVGQRGNRL